MSKIITINRTKRKKTNYINNRDFYEKLVEYKKLLLVDENATMSPYIGKCIIQICNKLSTNKSFSGYSFDWKDEMIRGCNRKLFSCHKKFQPREI